MALTAKFIADFSSFTDAVNKAEVELKSFEGNANKVGVSLTKMTNSFSGTKIIQDAHLMTAAMVHAGGITALTEKELKRLSLTVGEASDKMRRMGIEVPPGFQKVQDAAKNIGTESSRMQTALSGVAAQLAGMFTVGAVVSFGREVLRAGDTIQKMADQTGLSIQQVQKLQYIAGQSGTSITSLVGAVQNLQQRLGDDSSGAAGAMKTLGINMAELKSKDPYQQMVTLADGINGIKDPTEQASAAAAIFGKNWKEILPAIKSGMEQVGNEAPRMADETVKALDRIGDTLNRAKGQATAWGGLFVTAIEGAGFAFGNFLSQFNPAHFGVTNTQLLKLYGQLNDETGLHGAFSHATQSAQKLTVEVAKLAPVTAEAAAEESRFNETLRESKRANEAAAQAAKKRADELIAMSKAGLGAEFEWQNQILLTKFKVDQLTVSETQLFDQVSTLAHFISTHKGEMFPEPPQEALDKWILGQTVVKEMPPQVNELRKHIGDLANSFAQLGQIGGGALAGLTRGIGSVIAASGLAMDSVKTLKDGFGSLGAGNTLKGIASIASGIGGIVGVAQTAIAAVKSLWNWARGGEEGTVVNPARDKWFGGRSVQDIGDQLSPFMDGESARKLIEAVFNAKTQRDFESASQKIDSILGGNSFARGTGGKFVDFGSQGSLAVLHGKEKVVTEAEGRAEASGMAALIGRVDMLIEEQRRDRRSQARRMTLAWKDALAH